MERAHDYVKAFIQDNPIYVTVTPTHFCYPSGDEPGVIIGIINYPRFPKEPEELKEIALKLAEHMKEKLFQYRVTVMFPDQTVMLGDEK